MATSQVRRKRPRPYKAKIPTKIALSYNKKANYEHTHSLNE